MTSTETEQRESTPAKAWTRRRHALGDHVARTVFNLQRRLLADPPQPEAVSALAKLRRGIGRTPGFDYTLERYLEVPEELLGHRPFDDAVPAESEQAVHDALTLYALHQQSRRERMHVDGYGLGQALGILVHRVAAADGVRRRFAALGTASTYDESVYHLRSLITMLREHQIPVDYGLLAEDLQALMRPAGRSRIQAVWGREFFRARPSNPTETDPATPEESAS